ncbi:hypothetical protein SAMN05443270_5501 [Lacrimispora sphenoides]|jgi:hypothetical protein|nr:hypothetical protein SAMN05443270_5501 [Lacrimispora sphenoides]
MSNIHKSISELIGKTPLLELGNCTCPRSFLKKHSQSLEVKYGN